MVTGDMNQWLVKLGVNPQALAAVAAPGGAAASKSAAVAADPWAGAPSPPAAPSAPAELPQPMLPDCKIVHGKVPGPKNHLLCAKHGHVVDIDAKTIIAHDLRDYQKRQLVGKAVAAAAPVVQGLANAAAAIPVLGAAISGGTAKAPQPSPNAKPSSDPSPPEPKLAPEDRAYRINAGKTAVATKALAFLTASCTQLVNDLVKWKGDWEQKIKELAGEAQDSGGIFAKIFGLVAGAVAVVAPELAIAEETAKALEAMEKGADIAETVADGIGDASKESVEKVKKSSLIELQKLSDTVSDAVNRILKQGEAAIRDKLDGLDSDPAVAAALVNGADAGITFVIGQKLKILDPESASHAFGKMMGQLDVEMEKFLRSAVVEEKTAWMDKDNFTKKMPELKEKAVADAKEDYDQAEYDYDLKRGDFTVAAAPAQKK